MLFQFLKFLRKIGVIFYFHLNFHEINKNSSISTIFSQTHHRTSAWRRRKQRNEASSCCWCRTWSRRRVFVLFLQINQFPPEFADFARTPMLIDIVWPSLKAKSRLGPAERSCFSSSADFSM